MVIKLERGMRSVAIGAAAVAVAIGGFLLVQDQRHGWPFSRHHHVQSDVGDAPTRPAQSTRSAQQTPAIARAAVDLAAGQLDALGIQIEPVRVEMLTEPARAVATVVADESRISHVHTRVAGWVEELFVNTTGQRVRAGQPLAAVFSQELLSSQNELLAALRQAQSGPSSAVIEAARTRLRVLGMSHAEIAEVESARQARRLITVAAPRGGVILRRGVTVGTAVDPSTEIVTIADLSRVWVLAEVSEADAVRLKPGASAMLSFPASGLAPFKAAVDFIYPTLTERTRTVRVRFSVANGDGTLRPGLYGTAEVSAPPREVLTVARDAVVYTGDAQHVFVRAGRGVIEPRNIKIGARGAERIEVIEGLTAGDQVITTGVFLIDSESRLRASGGIRHAGHGNPEQRAPEAGANARTAPAPQEDAQTTPAPHSTHNNPE